MTNLKLISVISSADDEYKPIYDNFYSIYRPLIQSFLVLTL